MDFVHGGVDFGGVEGVPLLLAAAVDHDEPDPAESDQEGGQVAVVDEETCLSRALEAPVHRISAEKGAGLGVIVLSEQVDSECVSDLAFDGGGDEGFGLVGDAFVGGCVEEDEDGPEAYAFV